MVGRGEHCLYYYYYYYYYCRSIFFQVCEITRNSEKIRAYSSSRPSKVINLRKRMCNFPLVINNNFGRFRRFRFLGITVLDSYIDANGLFSPPNHYLTIVRRLARGNPFEFAMKLTPQKLEGWRLSYSENLSCAHFTVYSLTDSPV